MSPSSYFKACGSRGNMHMGVGRQTQASNSSFFVFAAMFDSHILELFSRWT